MVLTGLVLVLSLMAAIVFVWWVGMRTNPTNIVLDEVKAEVAKKAEGTKPRKPKAPKAKVSATRAPTLICPYCTASRSRRGEFKSKTALAAHIGRCKSKKTRK